ncbi:HEAT repeat domain-containing protein [Roseateles sp. DC23W]|uniref:HEAT repeat domain-containing protein n=1 Tax=Pelomonas dachongensis TaxID=3299029 RepID=A0ABW7EJ95_9BURK
MQIGRHDERATFFRALVTLSEGMAAMKRRAALRCLRTTQRLVRAALRGGDGDRAWSAIHALRARGSAEMLALLHRLSRRAGWRHRALAMNVAAQLMRGRGSGAAFALEATQQLLLAGLGDSHAAVLRATVAGLGHRPHPAALPHLVRLATHADDGVRFNVAFALGAYEEPPAAEALLMLARDPRRDVCDWATFALGAQHDADTPAIRACLWQNVHDPDDDVRCEALIGLARRGDPRLVDHLLARLADADDVWVLELEAAEKLGDPRLIPSLQALAQRTGEDLGAQNEWARQWRATLSACGAPLQV